MEQNNIQIGFLTKKNQRLERIIMFMFVGFAGILFISFTHKRNDTFGSLKVEHLEIVDENDTVLELGVNHDGNYRSGYINGYGGSGNMLAKDFILCGNSATYHHYGELQLYRTGLFQSKKISLDFGSSNKGAYIDLYDNEGKFSKSIKVE